MIGCSSVVDAHLSAYIADLEPATRDQLKCPTEDAHEVQAQVLGFEHGYMLLLDDPAQVYISYENDQWRQVAKPNGDADEATTPISSTTELYQPVGLWGELWQTYEGQRLGYARQPKPEKFKAIIQSFTGNSTLVAMKEDNQVYLFLGALHIAN